jgi:hypothetical protein
VQTSNQKRDPHRRSSGHQRRHNRRLQELRLLRPGQ